MNRALMILIIALFSSSVASAAITSFDVDSVTVGGERIIGPDSTFTVTFSDPVDASTTTTLNLNYDDRGIDRFQPSRCSGTTCTFNSVPIEEGWLDAYVSGYAQRIRLYADTQGPLVTEATFDGSSVSFTLSDQVGVSEYRLQRAGTIITTGSGSSISATLSDPLVAGSEAFFTLVAEDALGNVAVEHFSGIVESQRISITDIDTQAVLGSNDLATLSFTVAGPLDPGSAAIYVDGTRYGAICSDGLTKSCLASFPASIGSTTVLAIVSSPFGSRASAERSVTFAVDSSPPSFERINTPFLSYTGNDQYAHDSFNLEFVENGMIDRYSVEVEVGGVPKIASSCARIGSIVSCEVPLTGSGSTEVEFFTARDTAGNTVGFPDGSITSTTLQRDTLPPRIDSVAISQGGVVNRATEFIMSSAGSITIIATVYAEGSRLGLLEVVGTTDSGGWEETFSFSCTDPGSNPTARCTSEPIPISESTRLELSLFDGSGIPYETSRLVSVSEGLIDEGIHDWDIVRIDPIQGYYLEGGVLPTTVEVEVGAPTISSAMALAGVSVTECDGITDPFAASNGETVTITGYVRDLSGDTATCTLELTTMRNGRIESGSQTIEVEIPFEDIANAGIPDPISLYRDNPAARQTGVIIDRMDEVLGYGEAICTGYETVNTASLITNLASSAAGGNTNPIGAALSTVGFTLFKSTDALDEIAGKFCPVVQCKIPLPGQGDIPEPRTFQDAVLDFYGGIEGPVIDNINDKAGSDIITTGSGIDRVQDSLVLSAFSMCLPGVIDNVNDIAQVECGRQLCLLKVHTGDYGGSAAMCDYAANIQQCVFISDELFAIVPFGSFAEGFGSIVESIASRPLQLAVDWAIDAAIAADPALRAALNADLGVILSFMGSSVQTATGGAAEEIPDYCEQLNEYVTDLNDNRGYTI